MQIPQDVFVAWSEQGNVHDALLDVERWTEMLCDVAFSSSPANPPGLRPILYCGSTGPMRIIGSMPAALCFWTTGNAHSNTCTTSDAEITPPAAMTAAIARRSRGHGAQAGTGNGSLRHECPQPSCLTIG